MTRYGIDASTFDRAERVAQNIINRSDGIEQADRGDLDALAEAFEIIKHRTALLVSCLVDVVFDGPPGDESGRFVEVEDQDGNSINAGEWIDRGDGLWALRIAMIAGPALP